MATIVTSQHINIGVIPKRIRRVLETLFNNVCLYNTARCAFDHYINQLRLALAFLTLAIR